MSTPVRPGKIFRTETAGAAFRQRFTAGQANLLFLSCGEYHLEAGGRPAPASMAGQESLLYQWKGSSTVTVDGVDFALAPYDVLYVPLGSAYSIAADAAVLGRLEANGGSTRVEIADDLPLFAQVIAQFQRKSS